MRRPLMILAAALMLSGCNDNPTGVPEQLLGTWILRSVSGEQLPWQNQTGTYSVRSGSITFFEDFRYERVRTIEGFVVIDRQVETGSFEFDGERIKMIHDESGLSYGGTAKNGKVTLAAGPSNTGTCCEPPPSYEYKR